MHAACPSLEHLACYTLLVHTLIAEIHAVIAVTGLEIMLDWSRDGPEEA